MRNRIQFPAFGSWDYCDDHSFARYFESSTMPAGCGEDDDLFKVAAAAAADHHHHHPMKGHEGQQRKQGKVCGVVRTQGQGTARRGAGSRGRKAVDEDLYQIPPELIYQKPKRKRMLGILWSGGCLGLNCVCKVA
ncbi:hypothetical protein Cni_G12897 [Canna indica]|uniref:Uncharacterized protein n=1 Tax=Canna indica TaxID=4628 RepID=A0AAQ3Q9F4_9LILI|nr:hypothetical protein Cni_G12897 [Canna indica]